MKYVFLILLCFVGFQQTKAQETAFLDEQKLLTSIPEYQDAVDEAETVKEQYSNDINQLQKKLQSEFDELFSDYKISEDTSDEQLKDVLSEEDFIEYNSLKKQEELFKKEVETKQKKYDNIYKEKVGKVLGEINSKITDYCKLNNIKILYKKDKVNLSLVFLEADLDITDKLVEFIND